MTYRIAYGCDTETLADPDEMVLLDLADECAEMEYDDLTSWITDNWGGISIGLDGLARQPLVGLADVLGVLRQRLLPVIGDEALEALVADIYDATGQND
jgi:hypothetical protein